MPLILLWVLKQPSLLPLRPLAPLKYPLVCLHLPAHLSALRDPLQLPHIPHLLHGRDGVVQIVCPRLVVPLLPEPATVAFRERK